MVSRGEKEKAICFLCFDNTSSQNRFEQHFIQGDITPEKLYHPGHQVDITFDEWAGDVLKREDLDGGVGVGVEKGGKTSK